MKFLKHRFSNFALPCAGVLLLAGTLAAAPVDPDPEALQGDQAAPSAPVAPVPPVPPPQVFRMMWAAGASYLGIGVAEIDNERAKALNLKEERGVEITQVEKDSPAEKAGLQKGDAVLEYNGQRVEGLEQFMRLVRETPVGRPVKLTVSRGGATQSVIATTAPRKTTRVFNNDDFKYRFEMPEIRIPDIPRPVMGWRSSTIGIETESLDTQLAEFFGVKEGVLVRSVVKGSAAEKAGLKAGDVITKVDGQKVASPRDISNLVRAQKTQRTFPLTLVREKRETSVNVTVEEERKSRPTPRPHLRLLRRRAVVLSALISNGIALKQPLAQPGGASKGAPPQTAGG